MYTNNWIDGRIYLNLLKSVQSAAGLDVLKPDASALRVYFDFPTIYVYCTEEVYSSFRSYI